MSSFLCFLESATFKIEYIFRLSYLFNNELSVEECDASGVD